jgi:hypothetical protein
MSAPQKIAKPSWLFSLLANKCPRCRKGSLYITKNAFNLKKVVHMHEKCTCCGQPSEIEVGFYYGTAYLSYAITIALTACTFILYWLIAGIAEKTIFWWLGINTAILIIGQPLLMRFSRTLWLYFFVKYDDDWQKHKPEYYERIIPEHMGNW